MHSGSADGQADQLLLVTTNQLSLCEHEAYANMTINVTELTTDSDL